MADRRTSDALSRIEQALARIEGAAERPPAPAADDRPLRELREVHAALRGKVETAIEQIDRLIETRGAA
jgi:hypothetical protein